VVSRMQDGALKLMVMGKGEVKRKEESIRLGWKL